MSFASPNKPPDPEKSGARITPGFFKFDPEVGQNLWNRDVWKCSLCGHDHDKEVAKCVECGAPSLQHFKKGTVASGPDWQSVKASRTKVQFCWNYAVHPKTLANDYHPLKMKTVVGWFDSANQKVREGYRLGTEVEFWDICETCEFVYGKQGFQPISHQPLHGYKPMSAREALSNRLMVPTDQSEMEFFTTFPDVQVWIHPEVIKAMART